MIDDQTDGMPVATQFDEESPRHSHKPLTAAMASIRNYRPPFAVSVALITAIVGIALLAFALSYSSRFGQYESVPGSEEETAQGADPPQAQDAGLPQPPGPASLAEGTDGVNQSSDAFLPTAAEPVGVQSGDAAGLPALPPMPSPEDLAAGLPPITWPALDWPALNWPAINVPAINVPAITIPPGVGSGAYLTQLQDLLLPDGTPQLPNLTPQLPNLTPQLPELQLPDLTSQLPELTPQPPELQLPSPPNLRLPGL
jgi:hypothetical protein